MKGPGDFVSNADRKAEKIVKDELLKARPTLWLPWRGKRRDRGHRWRASLDRRSARRHDQLPCTAFRCLRSRSRFERNNEIVAGVVFNPATDELYTAERGGGAFLNDRRLRVGARRVLSDSVVACGVPHLGRGNHGKFLIELRHVMGEVAGIRRMGAASLDLPTWPPVASTASGKPGCRPGISRPASCLSAKPVATCPIGMAASSILETGSVVAGNEYIQKALLEVAKRPVPEPLNRCCKDTVFVPRILQFGAMLL